MFQNRLDAARQLAAALNHYKAQHPVVLAIPRGAVPMALVLAQQLGADMDVVLVRKLRAPYMPEVAIGAVDESGKTYLAPYAQDMGADWDYLQAEKRPNWPCCSTGASSTTRFARLWPSRAAP